MSVGGVRPALKDVEGGIPYAAGRAKLAPVVEPPSVEHLPDGRATLPAVEHGRGLESCGEGRCPQQHCRPQPSHARAGAVTAAGSIRTHEDSSDKQGRVVDVSNKEGRNDDGSDEAPDDIPHLSCLPYRKFGVTDWKNRSLV